MKNAPDKNENWLLNDEEVISENLDNFVSVYDILLRINYLKKEGIKNLRSKNLELESLNPTIYDIIEAIKNIYTLDTPGLPVPVSGQKVHIDNNYYDCLVSLKILSSGINLQSFEKLLERIDCELIGEQSDFFLNYFTIAYNATGEYSYTFKRYSGTKSYLFILSGTDDSNFKEIEGHCPWSLGEEWKQVFYRSCKEYNNYWDNRHLFVFEADENENSTFSFQINWTQSDYSGEFAYFNAKDLSSLSKDKSGNLAVNIQSLASGTISIEQKQSNFHINWIINFLSQNLEINPIQKLWLSENNKQRLIINRGKPYDYDITWSNNSVNSLIISLQFEGE